MTDPRELKVTVNGQSQSTRVADRTQLAEILRDQFHLTGTHLGCEQGVCGACTVLVNGRPVRSCLTYAGSCEDATIETVEGFINDAVMDDLRAAFTRHHALQCGFCTPGMLISAYDIVKRSHTVDEKAIRRQLSGNLCRCTGYMGIVAAIADVIDCRNNNGNTDAVGETAPHKVNAAPAFKSFDIDSRFKVTRSTAGTPTTTDATDGWTLVQHTITLNHPLTDVWALFEDLPRLARCLPGASVTEVKGDTFNGHFTVTFGPIKAGFAVGGTRQTNAEDHSGQLLAQGQDVASRSLAQGELRYHCEVQSAQSTLIDITLRFNIQGSLAQFNRPDLVNSFSQLVVTQFAANCQQVLDGNDDDVSHDLKGLELIGALIKRKLGF